MIYRNKAESEKSINLCKKECVICGWHEFDRKGTQLVEGAHIKPLCNDADADTFDNIIALCPNHHTQFDGYLFYIDPQNLHTVFMDTSNKYHDVDLSEKIKYVNKKYLAYRQYLFEKQGNLVNV